MKLYTEEQVRQAYNAGIINGYSQGIEKENNLINSILPIKLPSDEEIGEATRTKSLLDCSYETNFRLGAIWMKEQLLQPNL